MWGGPRRPTVARGPACRNLIINKKYEGGSEAIMLGGPREQGPMSRGSQEPKTKTARQATGPKN